MQVVEGLWDGAEVVGLGWAMARMQAASGAVSVLMGGLQGDLRSLLLEHMLTEEIMGLQHQVQVDLVPTRVTTPAVQTLKGLTLASTLADHLRAKFWEAHHLWGEGGREADPINWPGHKILGKFPEFNIEE